jgi:hypothetical protein
MLVYLRIVFGETNDANDAIDMVQEVEESEPATRRLLLSLLSDSSKDAFARAPTPTTRNELLHQGSMDHGDAQRMAPERTGSDLQPVYDLDTDGDAWIAETQDVRRVF